MYLKEIKAHGFKSFADRIRIELNPTITGVVGPNGSGKSNVVDAVRWVLGEQSVKSLRGDGNMTDVIFSGSKTRNPLNVASVTLTFDNTDHYLPVDYNEVSMKRRVYKDGTNEYYLNGEKCRLKDITDILLDSGIAKESFHIISQGKIEEILASKPVDRRVIFEEAAGVLKYKRRKEDALRKLERTHANMERVGDIIKELEIQVEPLKIQAEAAKQYIETKEELEQIEIALLVSDITSLNEEYQTDKRKIEGLKDELTKIATVNSTQEAKMATDRGTIHALEQQIHDKQAELLRLTQEVEQINSRKMMIQERQKYATPISHIHTHLLSLKEQQLQMQNELNALENIILVIKQQQTKKKLEIEDHEEKMQQIKIKKEKIEQQLTQSLRNQNTYRIKIEQLQDDIDHNGTLPHAVKEVLNNPKLCGIHNAIGNVIEVEDTYTTAVSIALGASSSYLIVDDEQVAKDAISYLKSQHIGRATFFPLSVIKPRGIDPDTLRILENSDGYLGILSDLIAYDPKYRGIIQNQLGNVVLASTIDDATRLSKKIGYRYRIVTLDGELFHVGGSLTGGNTAKTRSVFDQKKELEQMLKEQVLLIEQVKNFENMMNQCDYEWKSEEDKRYLANKEKISQDELFIQKQKQIEEYRIKQIECSNEIENLEHEKKGTLSLEEQSLLTTYYETVGKRDQIDHDLTLLNKEKTELNDTLEEYEQTLRKDNSLYHSKSSELSELEIAVNRMDVKLDTFLTNLSETYSLTYENAKANYHLELPDTLARGKLHSLKQIMKELGTVNLGAKDEYERVKTRYEFLLSQQNDLSGAENTLLDIIKEMDQVMEKDFLKTFKVIEQNFSETFRELFKGGHAELKLTDPEHLLETGVEIIASPPGKKLTTISLLSGGEKTFTAISLLFAILKSRPSPFCILDEVEAALDEVNVDSFGQYLLSLKEKTQFIIITHKKKTMEYADILYGITMQESGVSKLVSVKLEELK